MKPAHDLISFSLDLAEAALLAEPVVLVLDLDARPLQDLAMLPPTAEDVASATSRGVAARKRFFTRRALLRHFLGVRFHCAAADVVVASKPSGAPRLLAPRQAAMPFLSIAGRGGFAAFAVAARPIGVDLEILGSPEEVPNAMLHEAERNRLAGLDEASRHQAFLKIWTLKEAYVKALEAGLAREPSDIEVRFGDDGEIQLIDRGARVPAKALRCEVMRIGHDTLIISSVLL